MKARWLGVFFTVICMFVVTGCAASAFLGYKMNPDYPKAESQTVTVGGLSQPATVYIDENGVSHIDAQTLPDLLRATGYVHGRDRYFGMDMMRRFARGRVSELVGEQKVGVLSGTTVEIDQAMRGWGFDASCKEDAASLDEQTRALFTAYVEGVNKALAEYTPIEYRLLRVDPQPWTIEDCFALGRLVGWSITHNWHQETSRLLLALSVGLDRAAKIYPNTPWQGGTSIADRDVTRELPPAIAPELSELIKPRKFIPTDDGSVTAAWSGFGGDIAAFTGASNSWVVSGKNSVSGMPLSANDPHMSHLLPSMFYLEHQRAPGYDVIGTSIAGLPFIVSGHNRTLAWGMTSAVSDVMDLYVEKTDDTHPNQYLTPDGWRDFEKEEHVITVRDGNSSYEKRFVLRKTIHGPLMNDMYPKKFPVWAPPVAIHWVTPKTADSLMAFYDAGKAKTVQEFNQAMQKMTALGNTITVADTVGTIGIIGTGAVPIRPNHLGTFPVPGWLKKYEWAGLQSVDQAPHEWSTEVPYYAHANNLMINPAHNPNFFNIDSAPSYRVDRILEMLTEKPKHSVETMRWIQRDVKLLRAQHITPLMVEDLVAIPTWSDQEKIALEILKNWDFVAGPDAAAPAIFFMTYREAVMAALEDEVDPHSFDFIMAQRYSTNVADLWFDDPEHVVWDNRGTPTIEVRNFVVPEAFRRAVAKLSKNLGSDPTQWQWGAIHKLHPKHMFGSKRALQEMFNLQEIPVGGGLDSVWKSHFDLGNPKEPFRAMAGPVYRHIVDLGDIDNGLWISDTGVSGWPGSPHYGDQFKLWQKAEYLPMLYNWETIKANAAAVLTLQ